MNFSDIFKQSGQHCTFSPDGLYLATAVQHRLVIRNLSSLQISQFQQCMDTIQYLEWSPDSKYIVCGLYKRSIVQIWSIENPDWTCKIDEGSAGLTSIVWSPDSRHIFTIAEFHLRITIWSLISKSVSYMKYPKSCSCNLDFSPDGKYVAIAERRNSIDYISIFDCVSWQLVKHFKTNTDDLDGIKWAPKWHVICAWESCLKYKVLLYSLDGREIGSYSAYDLALGIKSISWSPTGQLLAIGSYDEKLRILNHVTWRLVAELTHPATTQQLVYKEVCLRPQLTGDTSNIASNVRSSSRYEAFGPHQQPSTLIPVLKPDMDRANPRIGVGSVAFSACSNYLYTRNDNMPTAVWVWSLHKLSLMSVLLHESQVRCAVWHPSRPRLAICTGGSSIYFWTIDGSMVVQVPGQNGFNALDLKWAPDGGCLAVLSKDCMCLCYVNDEESEVEQTVEDNLSVDVNKA